jgi:hypothetical protein
MGVQGQSVQEQGKHCKGVGHREAVMRMAGSMTWRMQQRIPRLHQVGAKLHTQLLCT